jgi:hypothetical protein
VSGLEKGARGKTTPRERRIIMGEPSDSALAWPRARVRLRLALARGGAIRFFFVRDPGVGAASMNRPARG